MQNTYSIPQVTLHVVCDRTIEIPCKTIASPADLARIAHAALSGLACERLLGFAVNSQLDVTNVVILAQGGMGSCAVSSATVLRAMLVCQASAFFLAHNHPSGDATPSEDDRKMTGNVQRAARAVGLPLMDHVVVTDTGHFTSLIEGGKGCVR
jgi:DNA repair protein RadC